MASETATIIGHGAKVRGRITGTATLEILGLVDGEILVSGDLTVGETGMVASDLSGRRVVVRGAVKGNVTGEESVHLEDGAKVVGDVSAPRIAIAAGAMVRGHVQTGAHGAARTRASAKPAVASKPATKPATAPAAIAAARPAAPRAVALSGGVTQANLATSHMPPPMTQNPKRSPPPPIVPALKKGAKGALAKKR